jgi:hypothetical protein
VVTKRGKKVMRVATADLLARAQAGDGDAFRELTEPHRRELLVHCYRMLGSFQTPRTPSKTRCWPPGKVHSVRGTRLAPYQAPIWGFRVNRLAPAGVD